MGTIFLWMFFGAASLLALIVYLGVGYVNALTRYGWYTENPAPLWLFCLQVVGWPVLIVYDAWGNHER